MNVKARKLLKFLLLSTRQYITSLIRIFINVAQSIEIQKRKEIFDIIYLLLFFFFFCDLFYWFLLHLSRSCRKILSILDCRKLNHFWALSIRCKICHFIRMKIPTPLTVTIRLYARFTKRNVTIVVARLKEDVTVLWYTNINFSHSSFILFLSSSQSAYRYSYRMLL